MDNPEYKYRIDCHCVACGKKGQEYVSREAVEDELLPSGFVFFRNHVVCSSHVMEARITRPKGKNVGYDSVLWADGVECE